MSAPADVAVAPSQPSSVGASAGAERGLSAAAAARARGALAGGSVVVAAARETYAQNGLLGFYRGLGWTLLRAAPVAGVVLPVYDVVKEWLELG